jgi:hypothetical protein
MHNFTPAQDIVVSFEKASPRDSNWPEYWVATQITGTPQEKLPAIQVSASGFMVIHYFTPENTDQGIFWAGSRNNHLNYGQYGGDTVYLKRVYTSDGGKSWMTY